MPRIVSISAMTYDLRRYNLLPAIVFRSSRSQCDADAERAFDDSALHLSQADQLRIKEKVKEVVAKYDMEEDLILEHPQYKALVATGIGAHHAGQLLMWRLLLEELMAAGLLRVLVATGTVAAGVDFPARTVVITAHSRRSSEGFSALRSSEFQQMSGRAGRRGKDTVGFCLAAPSQFCDARMLLKIASQPAEPLVSAYFPSPSTVLNLLRYRTSDDLLFTVGKSLAAYVDQKNAALLRTEAEKVAQGLPQSVLDYAAKNGWFATVDDTDQSAAAERLCLSKGEKKLYKRVRRLFRQAEEISQRQVGLLKCAIGGLTELGYLLGNGLSEKGYWASNLCTSLVLELAEIIEEGLLDGASVSTLVAVVASISGDEHRQYLKCKQSPVPVETQKRMEEILKNIGSHKMPGVSEQRKVLSDAAHTVLLWLHVQDWREYRGLLKIGGSAEGDAARLITQTAEHMGQLSRLYESHKELSLLAEEARQMLLRPPLTEVINLET